MFGLSDYSKNDDTVTLKHDMFKQQPLTSTYLPDEVSERVSPVEDLPVGVHPDLCNTDFVALKQILVWEGIRQAVVVQVGHTGAGYHLHGPPT